MKPVLSKLAACVFVFVSTAHAALHDRGGGLIYDDVLQITWLQDANYAKTSGYDADGKMAWGDANTWAANLVFGGYSDWRLPYTAQPDYGCNDADNVIGPYPHNWFGYNCTASELGHLFYVDGKLQGGIPFTSSPILNSLFIHIQGDDAYWSTEYAYSPVYDAWRLNANTGFQYPQTKVYEFYAWAVRDGDVAKTVPEPEIYTMMLAGLGLIATMAKRRKANH